VRGYNNKYAFRYMDYGWTNISTVVNEIFRLCSVIVITFYL